MKGNLRKLGLLAGRGLPSSPMTTAQVVFAAALGSIAIGISLFAVYVLSSTVWGDRWVRKGSDRT